MESASHAQTATEWVNRNAKYNPGSGTRSVLQTMAAAYGANGACLSMNELASLSSVSIATAHRATKKLAEDRVIAITPNAGDYRKGGLTNRYQFYGFDLPPLRSEKPPIENTIPSIKKDDTPSLTSEPLVINLPDDYVPLPFDDLSSEHARPRAHTSREKESLNTNTTTTTTTTSDESLERSGGGESAIAPLPEMDSDLGKIASSYEKNIGALVESMRQTLITAMDTYPAAWIIEAIDIAVQQNKRTWAYINGILKRWKREGKNAPVKLLPKPTLKPLTAEELDELRRKQSDGFYMMPQRAK